MSFCSTYLTTYPIFTTMQLTVNMSLYNVNVINNILNFYIILININL